MLYLQGAASGGLEQLLQAIPSGELQQLVGVPRGGYNSGGLSESPFRGFSGRDSELGVAKMESMELPDAAAAVAMLHDMPPEVYQHPFHLRFVKAALVQPYEQLIKPNL